MELSYVPRRYCVTCLVYVGILCQFSMRRNLDVAIVTMVNTTSEEDALLPSQGQPMTRPEFDWSQTMIGVLFACFYSGYLLVRLLTGYLFERYSSIRVLEGSIFLGAVIHIIQPPAARLHVSAFIIALIMQGIVEGMTVPAAYAVLGDWAQNTDKTPRTSYLLIGQYIGMFIGTCATGAITDELGWAASFYIFGIIGIIWGVVADISIRDLSLERPPKYPDDDNFFRPDSDDASSRNEAKFPQTETTVRPPVPWKRLLTSPSVLAIVVCHVCLKCAAHLMLTYAPLYYVHSFNTNVRTVGTAAGIPVLIVGVGLPLAGMLADSRYGTRTKPVTLVRKTFNTIGFFGLAFCYILLAVSTGLAMSITSFCLAGVFVATAMGAGFGVSPTDIAPPFAGLINKMSASVAQVVGSNFVVIVGLLTKHKTRNEWSIVFTVTACFLIVAAILFLIFGSGDEQPWARDDPKEKPLTCTNPAGPPDVKAVFTKTILPVQLPLEEDYMERHHLTRGSDDEEEEELVEEQMSAGTNFFW